MNTTLWIIQVLLALIFIMSGVMKSTQPVAKLMKMGLDWAEREPLPTIRFIGLSQILGAIGLVLPMLLSTLPILTPLAALGLAINMVLAMLHHLKYNEGKAIIVNLALCLLALFVAYGRFISL